MCNFLIYRLAIFNLNIKIRCLNKISKIFYYLNSQESSDLRTAFQSHALVIMELYSSASIEKNSDQFKKILADNLELRCPLFYETFERHRIYDDFFIFWKMLNWFNIRKWYFASFSKFIGYVHPFI